MEGPTALIILDGFGRGVAGKYNAIVAAQMSHYTSWLENYPHTLLQASGAAVGLLPGMAGNSLVGHMTIGSGRIVPQPVLRIHESIVDGSFFKNELLRKHMAQLRASNGTLHLMGLLSDGGNHSHEELLHALIRLAAAEGLTKVVVHAFLDGRDAPPRSAAVYLEKLDQIFAETGVGVLGTVHGRSFAMDRTEHMELIQRSFDVLTQATPVQFHAWQPLLAHYYKEGLTDDLIPPQALGEQQYIVDGDGLIFFNIRADRARELTRMFLDAPHPQLLWFMTAIAYHQSFGLPTLLKPMAVAHGLLDVLRSNKVTMGTFAESEKYAHITYFFEGGRELINFHDLYVIVPSVSPQEVKVHPQLSAGMLTDFLLCSLRTAPREFYLINYANADMVGHTGDFTATVVALQYLDRELYRLYEEIVIKQRGTIYLTADHGKAEYMYDEQTEQPFTAHTTNPVPFILINEKFRDQRMELPLTGLADIAPFILKQWGLPVPSEMEQ